MIEFVIKNFHINFYILIRGRKSGRGGPRSERSRALAGSPGPAVPAEGGGCGGPWVRAARVPAETQGNGPSRRGFGRPAGAQTG